MKFNPTGLVVIICMILLLGCSKKGNPNKNNTTTTSTITGTYIGINHDDVSWASSTPNGEDVESYDTAYVDTIVITSINDSLHCTWNTLLYPTNDSMWSIQPLALTFKFDSTYLNGSQAPENSFYEQYFPANDSIYIEQGYYGGGGDGYYTKHSSFSGKKIK